VSHTIRGDDPRLTWQGIVSLQKEDDWVKPWRIPCGQADLFPEGVAIQAQRPSGARIVFRSDTASLTGDILSEEDDCFLDVSSNGRLCGTVDLTNTPQFQIDTLPEGDKLIELWLSPASPIRFRSITLPGEATIERFEDSRPRWITYGSSITQCRAAESPSQTWPAIVAQEQGLNLTCLGFGGSCHLHPIVARVIRDLPADFVSICAGVNIHGQNSLSPRSFCPALVGFVLTIRERHPHIPIVLTSPIHSQGGENTPNAVGFTFAMMRDEIATAVEKLKTYGDNNIQYISGLELFGPDLESYLSDGLHPNAEGYKLLGKNYLNTVIPKVFHHSA